MTHATQASMAIRPAREADSEKLQDLFREIDRHQSRLLPGDFPSSGQARPRSLILEGIRDRNGLMLVCERGGEILGCLRASLEKPRASKLAKAQPFLKVHDLIVARRVRNSGIGSALMAKAEEWARRKRARGVRLDVITKDHEALSFCDELGFEPLSASLEKRLR